MLTRSKIAVQTLGELVLAKDGRALSMPASRKTRALFVYLLLAGKPVRRDRLCDLFFDLPDDPRAALRWSLTKLRAMLGDDAGLLVADRERVAIDPEGFVVDAVDAASVHDMPLAGLDLPALDIYSLWLGAERAKIDRRRIDWLTTVIADDGLERETLAQFTALLASLGGPGAQAPPPLAEQTVRYCHAPDGVRIAYATSGSGSGPVLVKTANWLNHLELDWGSPLWGRMVSGLSEHFSLVRYDERANGLSDWDVDDLSFDALVSDLETVVDALELDRFALFGLSQGCAVSIEYAARHPGRVTHLILLGGYSTGWRHRVSPEIAAEREAVITLVKHGWAKDSPIYRQIFSQSFTPSATPQELEWFNDFQRQTVSPANAAAFLELFGTIDVRHRLAALDVPTLVLHARADQRIGIEQAIELASSIRGASLVTLDSDNHILRASEPAMEVVLERIRDFLS